MAKTLKSRCAACAGGVLASLIAIGASPVWAKPLHIESENVVFYAKSGYELYACNYYQKSMESVRDFKNRQLGNFRARLNWFKTNYGENCQFEEG